MLLLQDGMFDKTCFLYMLPRAIIQKKVAAEMPNRLKIMTVHTSKPEHHNKRKKLLVLRKDVKKYTIF